jgi:Lutheran blood group glycoprotein
MMESWLQGSDCSSPWGPLDILQGEAPRGDVYQGYHLLQGTGGAGWLNPSYSLQLGLIDALRTVRIESYCPQASPSMFLAHL